MRMHELRRLSFIILPTLAFIWFTSCKTENVSQHLYESAVAYGPYKVYQLPITKGVTILNPILITMGPGSRLFGANQSGEVYILHDTDGDGLEDEAALYCNIADEGLTSPAGFAFKGDTVYIGASQEVRAYLDTDEDGVADTSWVFFNDIPHSGHPYEWTSGLCFGPDGWLYCSLTTDSWNAGASPDPKGYRGSLIRISPDGSTSERISTGLRSVYGLAFHPDGNLFFVDNEGGGNPTEELNLYVKDKFYGHNSKKFPGHDSTQAPVLDLHMELAPSGIEFNSTSNDFGGSQGDLFISYYGGGERWNRGAVAKVKMNKNQDGTYTFEEIPVVDIPKLSDLTFGKDGSLYVAHHGKSDYWYNPTEDKSGGFYKIVYDPEIKTWQKERVKPKNAPLSANALEEGKLLYARLACLACHSTGKDEDELLGPTLSGISERLSREELLEEIMEPSKRIKPGMAGLKVTKKDGQVLLGRVVNSNEKELSLMLVGNSVVVIDKSEIATSEVYAKSLMYENLLSNSSQQEIDYLLDYILSLK
jgi:putative heme-binding domain-containing protein